MDEEHGTWVKEAEIIVPARYFDVLSVDDLDWLWRRYGLVLHKIEVIPHQIKSIPFIVEGKVNNSN